MPCIGLLSDSHSRGDTTRRAVDLLLAQGVDLLIHLGDVGSEQVIDALATSPAGSDKNLPAHLVFGNNDDDAQMLARYAQHLGIQTHSPAGTLSFGDDTLVFCHGHQPEIIDKAIKNRCKWVCHGHTHQRCDIYRQATRIINPGALFRTPQYTVATLETQSNSVAFFPLDNR